MDETTAVKILEEWFPPDGAKGDSGRVSIIGGSGDYTGAPYYAARAAFETCADLVYVYPADDNAALPLKLLMPEAIVRSPSASEFDTDLPELMRKDGLIAVCCGLGVTRAKALVEALIEWVKTPESSDAHQVLVLDGDVFSEAAVPLLCELLRTLEKAPPHRNLYVYLTPNEKELSIFKRAGGPLPASGQLPRNVVMVQKGLVDRISQGGVSESPAQISVEYPVAPLTHRRCGGQGDILAGILGAVAGRVLAGKQAKPNLAGLRIFNEREASQAPELLCAVLASKILRAAYALAEKNQGSGEDAPPFLPVSTTQILQHVRPAIWSCVLYQI